jgi:hypothetical protein
MKIALDYDKTYTADPDMWRHIIAVMRGMSHEVMIVTSRDPNDLVEDRDWFEKYTIPVIYCDYWAKRQVCEQRGISIDIWIDDNPYFIDHPFPEEEANKWRVA